MTITLRITDKDMERRLEELMQEHALSANMTVQMLLGYAFNRIDEEGKIFKPTVVFESE